MKHETSGKHDNIVDKLYEFITNAHRYDRNVDWCQGYIMAFYATGLISRMEYDKLNQHVRTIYHAEV